MPESSGTLVRDIFPSRERRVLVKALPHFCYSFRRLMLDNHRRVRELANRALEVLAVKVQRGLAKVLNKLITPWICAMSDPERNVAVAASCAWKAAFPTKKRQADALDFYCDDLLAKFAKRIVATPQSLKDRGTLQEASRRHERWIVCTLGALEMSLQTSSAAFDGGKFSEWSHVGPGRVYAGSSP